MNDRFKFRVWNKKNRKIYDWDFLANSKEDCTFFWCMHQAQNDEKNNILMQCTGLKDKNGNLIYEGDIVKIWKFSTGDNSKRVIIWNKVRCGFRLYTIDHYKRNIHECPQSMVNVTTLEIIGNIYENPDMIEEK